MKILNGIFFVLNAIVRIDTISLVSTKNFLVTSRLKIK